MASVEGHLNPDERESVRSKIDLVDSGFGDFIAEGTHGERNEYNGPAGHKHLKACEEWLGIKLNRGPYARSPF